LTAASLVSAPGLGVDAALALPRTTIRPGHAVAGEIAKRGRDHRRSIADGHPGSALGAVAVHPDLVPLANTTWDHPQMTEAVVNAIRIAASESGVDPRLLAALA